MRVNYFMRVNHFAAPILALVGAIVAAPAAKADVIYNISGDAKRSAWEDSSRNAADLKYFNVPLSGSITISDTAFANGGGNIDDILDVNFRIDNFVFGKSGISGRSWGVLASGPIGFTLSADRSAITDLFVSDSGFGDVPASFKSSGQQGDSVLANLFAAGGYAHDIGLWDRWYDNALWDPDQDDKVGEVKNSRMILATTASPVHEPAAGAAAAGATLAFALRWARRRRRGATA